MAGVVVNHDIQVRARHRNAVILIVLLGGVRLGGQRDDGRHVLVVRERAGLLVAAGGAFPSARTLAGIARQVDGIGARPAVLAWPQRRARVIRDLTKVPAPRLLGSGVDRAAAVALILARGDLR